MQRQELPDHVVDADEAGAEVGVEARRVHLADAAPIADAHAVHEDPRHQPRVAHAGECGAHGIGIGDVGDERVGAQPRGAEVRDHRLEGLGMASADEHVRAAFGETS